MSFIRSLGAKALVTLSFVGAMIMPISFVHAQLDAQHTGLQTAGSAAGLSTACSAQGTDCVATIIGRVINVALGFLGMLLVGLFLYAGFTWMTAGGEKDKVEHAQKLIANAVAGLVIVGISFALSSFILGQLSFVVTGTASATPTTP